MPNRTKGEEDRTEGIIRGLLKFPENRRCINCNSLGPQYVCTTFWTFVCTKCSGVHREFTHRVKSVSMAKFTTEEVSALQAGGNQRAREIYFKDWDPQRHSLPDTSNLYGLREFIKHAYVDRKYSGARTVEKLPKLKVDREDFFEKRRFGMHSIGPKSPVYKEKLSPGGREDVKNLKYYYDERRSPRFAQENSRCGGYKRSPIRFEVVDDRVRGNGISSGRHIEFKQGSSRSVDGSASQASESQKSIDKKNDESEDGSSANAQNKDASTSSGVPVDGKTPKEVENIASASLIDFNNDPQPPPPDHVAAAPQILMIEAPPCVQGDIWASSPSSVSQEKTPQTSNGNTVESLLFQMSVEIPRSGESASTAPIEDMLSLPTSIATPDPPTGQVPTPKSFCTPIPASTIDLPGASPNGSIAAPPVADSNTSVQNAFLSWNSPLGLNARTRTAPSEQLSQTVSMPARDSSFEFGAQPSPMAANSNARKELPVDLFTASYSSVPSHVFCWQAVPPQGAVFNTQYHPSPVPAFPSAAKSMNPFDFNDGATESQSHMFASMASVQGRAPIQSGPTLVPTSSLGASSGGLMQPHLPSSPSAMLPQSDYPASSRISTYVGQHQQASNNMLSNRVQDFSNPGNLSSITTNQRLPSQSSAPTAPLSFSSMGRNPFG